MKTLYELKQNLVTVGQQLKKVEEQLAEKAIDPNASMEDIQALQGSKSDLKMRFDVIKEQHDALEAEQKAKLKANFEAKDNINSVDDPKQRAIKAKAELIRSVMREQSVSIDVRQALGDNDTTGGNKFLPKTVSTDILVEPTVKNPLRELSSVTQITNLEIPKLHFTLDDDDFIADTETAKEMKADGDTVIFGRNKFKVLAGVSETVINGSDANLVSYVETALQSGVAAKEKKVAFTTNPKTGEEHMSFYKSGIKEIVAENMFDAITDAIADLHEDYRENAKIVMRYQDYKNIIKVLANGSATLYTAQPEQVLGKPVVFCDSASSPIIGDFNYSHFNYDLNALYDRDKDVKTGIEQFVVTAWFDHQIKLKSAFRIAKVKTP
ncbi:phage major capsid protein, HK97 family [Paenibacillus larvae subsp. larvae]|uniref:Major capsid protein n=7 Tax=root TaxID=1 RepID=A0A0K2CZG6_9CAUD|nr:phage major capsid protein [Paenibacillus larvae]YP_009193818.1 major capsid protein [Paenibacillus phage Harrison]YP_009196104.1 major capsid protein [Paenibacillus phage Vegas]ALA12571.1 major capsid protein [Paenibacillus phage Paisley]ALA12741.1 major capsid protein [Paenibacillus phage Hayley]ALA12825.1 major capsid protein [Paenibacillus phage Vadim]ALA12911.1 major capsid protein [Paenibacillus phage Diane]UYL92132.1 major capsid protein [Paenibacillus phage GaryLarson]UYL93113.1 